MATERDPTRPLLDALGARFDGGASERVLDFGDWRRELAQLRSRAAWMPVRWRSLATVAGADALRFLNGQLTCDVATLEPGRLRYGFFTSPQGRVIADARVLRLEDGVALDLPRLVRTELLAHLGKYALFDDVSFEPTGGLVCLAVAGPEAAERLAPWCGPIERGGCVRLESSGQPAARFERWGVDQFSIWLAAAEIDSYVDRLQRAGVVPAGERAVDALRVACGASRFGVDFGDDAIPQETGREHEAVDYTKGCYLGQEVVARVHYLGQPARLMMRVRSQGALAVGDEVVAGERAIGVVTTSAPAPAGSAGWWGLAVLQQKALAEGAALETESGVSLRAESLAAAPATVPGAGAADGG